MISTYVLKLFVYLYSALTVFIPLVTPNIFRISLSNRRIFAVSRLPVVESTSQDPDLKLS